MAFFWGRIFLTEVNEENEEEVFGRDLLMGWCDFGFFIRDRLIMTGCWVDFGEEEGG